MLDITARVHDERAPIKNQFVLATDLIDIQYG